jgi:hypothetical protein
MKHIWLDLELHAGLKDFLYLFEHCVLKSLNEAVVESGSIVSKHADPQRGLAQPNYAREAMIHWNGPASPHCESFLTDALNDHFGSGKPWHFTSIDGLQRITKFTSSSVIDRLKKAPSKFPFLH